MNFFDRANDFIRNVEGSFTNFISSIAPWGAPLPAAVMSFMHMTSVLEFQPWVAWVVAGTIEILGFSTISTWLSFWMWNRRYKSEVRQAPMGFILFAFGFYLAIIISMNVLLDASKYFPEVLNQFVIIIIVRGTLTLLTIPAGLIIATRVQHNDLLGEIAKNKLERKGVPVPSSKSGTGTSRNSNNKVAVFSMLDDILTREGRVASFSEVRDKLHIPQGSASRLRNDWIKQNNVQVKP